MFVEYVSVVSVVVSAHTRKGGSTKVIELHGRNDEVQCLSCFRSRRRSGYQECRAVRARLVQLELCTSALLLICHWFGICGNVGAMGGGGEVL